MSHLMLLLLGKRQLEIVINPLILYCHSILIQGGRGQFDVYYTSPQSFIITFSYTLALQF